MAAEVVVKFLGDSKQFDRVAGRVSGTLGGLGRAAIAGGAAVVGAAGVVGVASLRAFGDFDQAMTNSLAIMGDVSDTMKGEMSDAARQVALNTTFSATEAAESFFFLASAGLSAEASIAALPQVAAFAQAGAFDMALATDLLTDAQSALGLASDDAAENLENMGRVSDVLVSANTLANASVQQFSEALTNKAGPAMRAVGMDIEEGVAVLAAFADQGVKGDEAGTQFGIVLRDLQTKALANKGAFEEAGIAVFDASGEFNNMGDIIGDLEGSLDGMSDAQKKATLLALGFSDKSVSALTTLLGTSDAIGEYETSLRDAGGITQTVADKQLESFNAQMGLIKSRVTDLMIEIGSKLAPLVLKIFDRLDRAWQKHGDSIKDGFVRLQEVFMEVVQTLREFWDEHGEAIIATAIRLGTEVWRIIQKYWPQIKQVVVETVEVIGGIIKDIVTIATRLWDIFGTTIMNIVEIAWNFVVGVIKGAVKIIQGIFGFFAGLLTGDWQKMWDSIKLILSGAWEILKTVLRTALDVFMVILKGAWTVIKAIFKKLWEWAKIGFDAGWTLVKSAFNGVVDWIKGLGTKFLDAGKSLGSKIIDGIKSGISGVASIATSFARAVKDKIKSTVNSGIIDKVNNALEFSISAFGQTVNINPPDIPRLAKGGFVTSPTLAMVGDSPGEGEIVSPESKMREIVREEGGGGGVNIGTINMNSNVTPGELSRELAFASRSRKF